MACGCNNKEKNKGRFGAKGTGKDEKPNPKSATNNQWA